MMALMSASEVSSIVEKAVKTTNPRELALKGFYFGKLWHSAGNYNSAVEWIVKYLKAYDRDAQAHKLLGECYEKSLKYEAALTCYKQSLQIKPNQPELLLHVVELFLNPGPAQNPNKAQVWLDRAASTMPGNSSVFKLKIELLVAQQASPDVLENAILKEIKLRKDDLTLHEQYVSLLKTQGKLERAFAYCNKLENEQAGSEQLDDYDWCLCVVSTYKDYNAMLQNKRQPTHDLIVPQCLLLEALSRFVWLCVRERKFDQALEYFAVMDYTLHIAGSHSSMGEWQVVEEEMKAQLSWLAATMLLHQVDVNKLSGRDAIKLTVLLYAFSASKQLPSLSSAWAVHCVGTHTQLPERLLNNAGVRLSECSHMIHVLVGAKPNQLFEEILQEINLQTVGIKIHQHLFDNKRHAQNSFLCNTYSFTKAKLILPSIDDMLRYDETSALCGQLNHLVWLGIQWREMDYPADFFPWMKQLFSNLRLGHNATESSSALLLSLGLLDMESFIAACVFTTSKQLEIWTEAQQSVCGTSRPSTLTRRLTTETQEKWWKAALVFTRKLKGKSSSEISKIKPLLQRGLECIRGIGNHGLETALITKLAAYFASKAFQLRQDSKITSAWFVYQRRAALYWSLALMDLHRAVEGRVVIRTKPSENLFPSVFKQPTPEEAKSMLSDANMCHGELAVEENRIDDALSFYGKATLPQASFCQAHIYKKLSENAMSASLAGGPLADGEKQKELYFKKYRHCLEVTLTRLQQHPDDKLHEKTVGLLASLQMTPPKPTARRTADDSVSLRPGKQSTPKMDDSVVANSILSTLAEKDSVADLVESLSSLTSAVSSLKLEMGQLREENRMRQYSPSPARSSQAYATPSRYPDAPRSSNMSQPGTPSHYPGFPDAAGTGSAPPSQRTYMPQPSPMFAGVASDGRLSGLSDMQGTYQEAYHQQQQAYYTPGSSSSYYVSYPYQGYAGDAAVNGYAASSYPNVALSHQYAGSPYDQGSQSTNYSNQQPANVLAACLQDKANTDALQQKLGSALAAVAASPTSLPSSRTPLASTNASKPSAQQNSTSVQNIPSGLFQTPVSKPDVPAPGKSSLIEKLLAETSSKTEVSRKEVDFLPNFVPTSPKSTGAQLQFQSPEQMDRENQELEALEQADTDNSAHNDTGPHFEPKVSLPEVEVRTGEEDEDILFQERCRLYRWDSDQWKERGVGEIKLLRHPDTGKCRLVMRRDQVHKVCCNHFVTSSTALTPMQSSDRAMVWLAHDFSDEEAKNEHFAARFKTAELAQTFKKAVDAEAAKASDASLEPATSEPNSQEKDLKNDKPAEIRVSDHVPSTQSSISVASSKFQMPKPSAVEKTASEPEPQKPSMFAGLAGAMSRSFGGSGPEGGIKPGGFVYSFGPPKPRTVDPTADYGGTAKPIFGMASQQQQPAVHNQGQESDEEAADQNKSGDGPHFEPIIALPALVEAKTGEENEEITFCRRAKLFRFMDSQWKERGLGDMKILKHTETAKYRIVMRREQVLKLCANHHISSSMTMSTFGGNGKAWTWVAQDFSEAGETPRNEMFAVRFGSVDHAQEFKKSFDVAVAAVKSESEAMPPPTSPSQAASAFLRQQGGKQESSSAAPTYKFGSAGSPALSFASKVEQSEQKSVSSSAPPGQNSGFGKLINQKPAGSWSCTDCYSTNPPSTPKCLACNAANPNAPKQDTGSHPPAEATSQPKPLFKFGTNISQESVPKSTFSFGVPQTQEPAQRGVTTAPQPSAQANPGFGKLINQKPAGSWSCTDCYSTNPPSTPKCLACNAANPNAPKQDSASIPSVQPSNQPTPLFKFGTGISPAPSQASTFSFGVPQTKPSSASESGVKLAQQAPSSSILGKLISQKPAGSWSCTDCYSTNPPSTPKCLACNAANPNAPKQNTGFGKLINQKPAGSWSCTDCYSTNPPSTPKCLACNAANPNAPKQDTELPSKVPEGRKVLMQFGTGMFQPSPAQNSPFSFGTTQPAAATTKDELAKGHPTLQRAGGPPVGGFSFRLANQGTTAQAANLFGTSSSSNPFDQTPEAAAGIPKPRFPTLDDERAEETSSSEDDDDYSSSCTTDDDEDYPADSDEEGELHESPMTKFAAQKKKNDDDEDVICLGEVLPSEKLQEKARQLQLPLHFYNFKETGGSSSGNDDDDDDGDGSTPPTTSAVKSQSTSFNLNKFEEVRKREDPEKSAAESSVTSSGPFGSTMGGGAMSFADLASGKAGHGFSFGGVKSSSAWKPDDKPMFSQQNEADDADQSNEQDKEHDDLHFTPAISLPEIVPVVTGEEDEQTIYSHRAKLYRWDQGSAQWKERGVGDVCIKHNQSSHRYRIVMRREQVLKVCANHYLTADMKFTAHAGSEKAWTWVASDFSEGGDNTTMEQFAIKFKNEEIAQEFKDKVEECQVLLSTDPNSTNNNNVGTTSALISQVEKMKTELGFFKDKLLVAPKVDLDNTFTEGLVKTSSEKFALTPLVEKHLREKNQVQTATGMLLQSTDENKASTSSAVADHVSKSHLSLNKFEFKMKTQTGPPTPEQPEKTRNVSICSERSEDSHADSIHFEPKIPLPDKIEVMTGEESERVLFANRSKLYVFDRTGEEWKERGLGEMKVLQDQQTFQIRLVMRREQVLKVCLNHRVTNDINFTYKDNSDQKVLLWTATDFSDPDKQDGELLQFAIRYKTAEVASLFFETLTEAKQAASDSRLLDSFDVSQEQSSSTAPKDDSVISAVSDNSTNRSPVKVPSKPVIFSFANVQSPFQKDFGKNYFTDFAKDQQQTKPEAPTQSEKFNFSLSSMSFNFGSTSTPVTAPVFGVRGAAETEKPAALKSLFAAENTTKPEATADYETEKWNAATKTGIEQVGTSSFQFKPPASPFELPLASAGTKDTGAAASLNQLTPEDSPTEDDVVFVWEAVPNEDQKRRALQLQLPATFFLYEDNKSMHDSETLSDQEDAILEYISRRDNPSKDDQESVQDQHNSSEVQSEHEESDEVDGNSYVEQSDQTADQSAVTGRDDPVNVLTFGGVESTAEQIDEKKNVFGSFPTASSYSFASMAVNAGSSQAFGARKDAAFNVSASNKVLFTGQQEERDPDAYDPEYKPVLAQPPPLIEVKTGEEDEKVLFQERCKLYRFDHKTEAWKERGLGDLKILFHPELQSYRVVMRREQVLKVCANHPILPDMNLMSNTEKAWMYVAQDRSEGEPEMEKFTVKFKTSDIAMNFKSVFETAQGKQ